jgi:uncharacterized peroxidase-related enzyme
MMKFQVHTPDTAPEASRPLLEQVQSDYGFIPSVYGIIAESPVATSTYIHITEQLKKNSPLTPQEQQIVMIAVSEQNGCEYCVAAHSTVAGMAQVPQETIASLRDGTLPSDPKQAALVRFAKSAVENRGWIPEAEQQAFLDVGYTARHVLDVLSIIALKTLSNYANHLAHPPLDPQFESQRWSKRS